MNGEVDAFEVREDFTPDQTKFGAFFYHDNSSHRYELSLVSSSRVKIRMTLSTNEISTAFLIVKNDTIEGIAFPVTKNIEQGYSQWIGDLTKGTYTIVPFPLSVVK